MKKTALVFFALLIVASVSFSKEVKALSCMEPSGDPVQNIIDSATAPYWFGRATLLSFNDFTKKARFKIEETYLTNSHEPLNEVEKILISEMNLTWGPFQNIKDETSLFGIGSTNNMYFRYSTDYKKWIFGGPGGCVFFTAENWKALKNNEYEIKPTTTGVENAD